LNVFVIDKVRSLPRTTPSAFIISVKSSPAPRLLQSSLNDSLFTSAMGASTSLFGKRTFPIFSVLPMQLFFVFGN
jgi:hypothetical protein